MNQTLKAQIEEIKAATNQSQVDSELVAENEQLVKQLEELKAEKQAAEDAMNADLQLQNDQLKDALESLKNTQAD